MLRNEITVIPASVEHTIVLIQTSATVLAQVKEDISQVAQKTDASLAVIRIVFHATVMETVKSVTHSGIVIVVLDAALGNVLMAASPALPWVCALSVNLDGPTLLVIANVLMPTVGNVVPHLVQSA